MNWSYSLGKKVGDDMATAEHTVPCSYMKLLMYICGILLPVTLTVFAWHSGRVGAVEQKAEVSARELVEIKTVMRYHTEILQEIRTEMKQIRKEH
jgi:hypothetical protein